MSLAGLSNQDLLSRFSYQHEGVLSSMIWIKDLPKMPIAHPLSDFSSFGLFDKLPFEILHSVLHQLDLRSLSRLSQVSTLGYAMIQSLPAYRDLLQNAYHAMTALGRTGAICYHTLAELHEALCSQNCVSCGFFGAFLFLPTCERCCYACLSRNQSFWVTSTDLARKCFSLDQHHIENLPVLYSLPGVYEVWKQEYVSFKRRINLVSVGSAKALGIEVHGSTRNMRNFARMVRCRPTKGDIEREYLQWIQKAPMDRSEGDPVMLPAARWAPRNKFCSMASTPFPALINGEVDPGAWCRGCEIMYEELKYKSKHEIELALGVSIDNESVKVKQICIGLQCRARSKSESLTHIKQCYGVRKIVEAMDRQTSRSRVAQSRNLRDR